MAEDPLDKAVTKVAPVPRRAVRASEEFYPGGIMSANRRLQAKNAALSADVEDYRADRGKDTTKGYAKGGKVISSRKW